MGSSRVLGAAMAISMTGLLVVACAAPEDDEREASTSQELGERCPAPHREVTGQFAPSDEPCATWTRSVAFYAVSENKSCWIRGHKPTASACKLPLDIAGMCWNGACHLPCTTTTGQSGALSEVNNLNVACNVAGKTWCRQLVGNAGVCDR